MTAGKARRRTFGGDSPFSRVGREVSQTYALRKPLLKKLEKHFNARVVSFFTSFAERDAQLTDDDAEMLESVLAVEHDGDRLVLIVNSPGARRSPPNGWSTFAASIHAASSTLRYLTWQNLRPP